MRPRPPPPPAEDPRPVAEVVLSALLKSCGNDTGKLREVLRHAKSEGDAARALVDAVQKRLNELEARMPGPLGGVAPG